MSGYYLMLQPCTSATQNKTHIAFSVHRPLRIPRPATTINAIIRVFGSCAYRVDFDFSQHIKQTY